MGRPTDQEMVTAKKIICHSSHDRDGGTPYHTGPHGEHRKQWAQPGGRGSRKGTADKSL